jgi:hypothetical protein
MKATLSLLIILLLTQLNFAQAKVDIQLTFEDGTGESRTRSLGLDSLATLGIDVTFGEEALPPLPPGFEVRFDLNPFGVAVQTYKDYRNAPSFPYTDTVEHRLIWQFSQGATGLTIKYNLPIGVSMHITDAILGSIFNSGILSDSGSYIIPNGIAFTSAKLFMHYESAVPVEITLFSALLEGNKINLKWQTASEINNKGFDVERKIDHSSWQKIGFVQGYGTSSKSNDYVFVDKVDKSGKVHTFRLKQIDYDGSYIYSSEVSVNISAPIDFSLYQNYPNPFNPATTIAFSIPYKTNVKLTIYNQIGQLVDELVNSVLEAGTYNFTWNAENISSGIYLYKIQTENFKSIKKMTLIK